MRIKKTKKNSRPREKERDLHCFHSDPKKNTFKYRIHCSKTQYNNKNNNDKQKKTENTQYIYIKKHCNRLFKENLILLSTSFHYFRVSYIKKYYCSSFSYKPNLVIFEFNYSYFTCIRLYRRFVRFNHCHQLHTETNWNASFLSS